MSPEDERGWSLMRGQRGSLRKPLTCSPSRRGPLKLISHQETWKNFSLMSDEKLKSCGNPMLCLDPTAFSLAFQISINHVNEPVEVGGENKRSLRHCFANVGACCKELWLVSSSTLPGNIYKCISLTQSVSCWHCKRCWGNCFERLQVNVYWISSQSECLVKVLFMTNKTVPSHFVHKA